MGPGSTSNGSPHDSRYSETPVGDITKMTPAQVRSNRQLMVDNGELPPESTAIVEDISIPSAAGAVPARVYTPAGESLGVPRPILLWFHGGGMVIGDQYIQSDRPARRIVNRTDCIVVAVDFRLAPEHPFPAGIDDCCEALRWVSRHAAEIGGDPSRLAVEGDSGGGLPAAVAAVTARNEGIKLRHQLLIYPSLDMSLSEPTWLTHDKHWLTLDVMKWFREHYLPVGANLRDPRVSPLFTDDLTGVAPATLIVGEHDPLIGENRRYAQRLSDAGVPTELRIYPGMPHGFFVMPGTFPSALEAYDYAAERLRAAFSS
jgi:acetyl esterase